jgi:hypothetical protein
VTQSTQYSAGVQHLVTQSTQRRNGYVNPVPITDWAGVQHLVTQSAQHQNGYVNPVPIADSAGVQHLVTLSTLYSAGVQNLVNNATRHHDGYSTPVQITDATGVQNFANSSASVGTGLRGSGAIAESLPPHRIGHPGGRGSGAIACAVHRLEDNLRVPRLLEGLATRCGVALSRVPMRSRTAVGPSRNGVQACVVHLPVPLHRWRQPGSRTSRFTPYNIGMGAVTKCSFLKQQGSRTSRITPRDTKIDISEYPSLSKPGSRTSRTITLQ